MSNATSDFIIDDRSMRDILKTIAGKVVTIVNPESYETTPTGGHQITGDSYRATIMGVGADHLLLSIDFKHDPQGTEETATQYLPIERIKRVSILEYDRILHL